MGGRYLISGVQLGTIRVLIEQGKITHAIELLNKVQDEQFLWQNDSLLSDEIVELQKIIKKNMIVRS